ncbi:hypothetical protein Scep_014876 [Stephania cephalantha]|uniref:Uncharacterized protein n=1 Tax=Stephania cephalantha TaxID=152367 RepID=A0AAP0J3I5_9MAGN
MHTTHMKEKGGHGGIADGQRCWCGKPTMVALQQVDDSGCAGGQRAGEGQRLRGASDADEQQRQWCGEWRGTTMRRRLLAMRRKRRKKKEKKRFLVRFVISKEI